MPYFHVSHGLRGCYLPDSSTVIRVETRRALRDYLAYEVRYLDYPFGGSKREVARVAAAIWRDLKSPKRQYLDFVIPLGNKPGPRPLGLFVSHSTRSDYLEYSKEGEE